MKKKTEALAGEVSLATNVIRGSLKTSFLSNIKRSSAVAMDSQPRLILQMIDRQDSMTEDGHYGVDRYFRS